MAILRQHKRSRCLQRRNRRKCRRRRAAPQANDEARFRYRYFASTGRGLRRGPFCVCAGSHGRGGHSSWAVSHACARGKSDQGIYGGRRRQESAGGDRRALEGRRLRVPRPEARCRPEPHLRADQDGARHGRLWLVRQCHLPRQGSGQEAVLKLMDIRVQKGPKQDGDGYYMVTRMPVAWWWLPVQEHPGDMEVTRAWQVMSAI